jgi:hypothetical protein
MVQSVSVIVAPEVKVVGPRRPPAFAIPPPLTRVELLEIVHSESVAVPELPMPPPLPVHEFIVSVVLVIANTPRFEMPPPPEFSVRVQPFSVIVPKFAMPPPTSPPDELSETAQLTKAILLPS